MDITNMDDVIDSRDVIARIEELAEEIDANESDPDTYSSDEHETMRSELAALQALADEASGYAEDWECGETLIRDPYAIFARRILRLSPLDPIGALLITALAVWQITSDGEATIPEGVALVGIYAMLAFLTFFE